MTQGVVLHSTRGGASSQDAEFHATLDWFQNPTVPEARKVSAHVVIGWNGELAHCVPLNLIAWHARSYNITHLGAELTQPHLGDPISEAQYRTLAWWLLAEVHPLYPFDLTPANLPQHYTIPPGVADGKTDIEAPFSYDRLLYWIETLQTS